MMARLKPLTMLSLTRMELIFRVQNMSITTKMHGSSVCLSSAVALITTCHTNITLNPGSFWTYQGLTEVLPLDVQHGSGPKNLALNVEISLSRNTD